ncbi:unnamed protein product [Caenorhabditis brenneri]
MTPTGTVLINSRPLRATAFHIASKTAHELEEEAYEESAYFNSWGIVIWSKDGNGEVLVSEAFEDVGLHFIFTRTTTLHYLSEFEPLGVGSVVKIYWSRSFERVMSGQHIIVQVDKMEITKCARMLPEKVFVTFNSQESRGVAIGVTERNITVAFHPSCAPKSRFETLKALHDGRTEFKMKHKHRENTNRMVEVFLAAIPFRAEINGNFDKIPFLVIDKGSYLPGKEGIAVITKIIKYHFMEAYFLQSAERVYFDSKSCHSNILEKIAVGSLINVLASPAFPSSCYKWYGYDVTMCNSYLANASTQKSFEMTRNEILQNYGEEKEIPSLKYARSAFYKESAGEKEEEEEAKVMKPKKKSMRLHKFDSKKAQYKMRHLLLDQSSCTLNPKQAQCIIDAYYDRSASTRGVPNEFGNIEHRRRYKDLDENKNERGVDENGIRRRNEAMYSDSLQDGIRNVLEPFGLNRDQKSQQLFRPQPCTTDIWFLQNLNLNEAKKKSKHCLDLPKLTEEEIRERIGSLMDSEGFAVNQKCGKRFVLPDTRWNPSEKRWIGLDDDVQWVLMSTFCPLSENPKEKKELLGGWWYRRSVPRERPVLLVERLESRRNIKEDCTVSMLIE